MFFSLLNWECIVFVMPPGKYWRHLLSRPPANTEWLTKPQVAAKNVEFGCLPVNCLFVSSAPFLSLALYRGIVPGYLPQLQPDLDPSAAGYGSESTGSVKCQICLTIFSFNLNDTSHGKRNTLSVTSYFGTHLNAVLNTQISLMSFVVLRSLTLTQCYKIFLVIFNLNSFF